MYVTVDEHRLVKTRLVYSQASDEKGMTSMRKFSIVGAMVAAVAISAFAVAGASANVWLDNGIAVTETKATATHGMLEFHNIFLGQEAKILCSGLFVGTVDPEGKDLVAEVQNLAGTEKNLVVCESRTTSLCAGKEIEKKVNPKVTLHPENLPWSTQLLATSPITDDFTEDGKGEPAWLVLCEMGLFKEVLCKKNVSAHFVKNEGGDAVFEYTKASTVTTCSNGSEGWITGTGLVLGLTVS